GSGPRRGRVPARGTVHGRAAAGRFRRRLLRPRAHRLAGAQRRSRGRRYGSPPCLRGGAARARGHWRGHRGQSRPGRSDPRGRRGRRCGPAHRGLHNPHPVQTRDRAHRGPRQRGPRRHPTRRAAGAGMRLDVLTIFPEYLDPLRHALLGKAIESGRLQVGVHDLRQWATDRHKSVDDTPYGGGPGMVMKPSVWGPALDDVIAGTGPAATARDLETSLAHKKLAPLDDPDSAGGGEGGNDGDGGGTTAPRGPVVVVPTPAGKPFTQEMAARWSKEEHLVFACGRYEGIDQRVVDDAARNYRVEEVSIGDYVLIGGEVAVLVMAEAVVRLIPGVLGNQASHEED